MSEIDPVPPETDVGRLVEIPAKELKVNRTLNRMNTVEMSWALFTLPPFCT
jgi:hypothetical protein